MTSRRAAATALALALGAATGACSHVKLPRPKPLVIENLPRLPNLPWIREEQEPGLIGQDYIGRAYAADMFEIESAQTALDISANPAVRQFAQMILDDHRRLSARTMVAAGRSGLTAPPSPMLTSEQGAMLAALRSTPPHLFDGLYLQQQASAHAEALALHSRYARAGDKKRLRRSAQEAAQVVEGHIRFMETWRPQSPA